MNCEGAWLPVASEKVHVVHRHFKKRDALEKKQD
jgi:hypothetical protein